MKLKAYFSKSLQKKFLTQMLYLVIYQVLHNIPDFDLTTGVPE